MAKTLLANKATFQINLEVVKDEKVIKTISLLPKSKGILNDGESLSEKSKREFSSVIASAELPEDESENKSGSSKKATLPTK